MKLLLRCLAQNRNCFRMLWVLGLPASIISAPTLATSALRPYRGASLLHAMYSP